MEKLSIEFIVRDWDSCYAKLKVEIDEDQLVLGDNGVVTFTATLKSPLSDMNEETDSKQSTWGQSARYLASIISETLQGFAPKAKYLENLKRAKREQDLDDED